MTGGIADTIARDADDNLAILIYNIGAVSSLQFTAGKAISKTLICV